jgi:signal transduction histidine kinase
MVEGRATRFDDALRLAALRDYRVLDTPPEAAFDSITELAAQLFGAPIALVSLVDETRQWFKSRVGLGPTETPREVAFCDHAIRQDRPFVVTDAAADERFRDNPLVTSDPGVRFYCGVPLRTPEGHGLGTLCIIDRVPREMSADQLHTLQKLAHHVELELEVRRRLLLLEEGLAVARRQQESKELLASMVVHDLRAPLTGITLVASLLEGMHPESKALFEELLDEADRMRRMLIDVLDLCLADTPSFRLRRVTFPFQPLARRVVRRGERLASRRKQAIHLELPEAPLMTDADPELLERILENLLGNATQHGPAGVPITLFAEARGDGGLRVEVRDLGATIAAEAREKIFHAFERSGDSAQRGFGLGLAFCQMAAQAHGGTVGVVPNTPTGNRFYLELPAPSAARSTLQNQAKTPA